MTASPSDVQSFHYIDASLVATSEASVSIALTTVSTHFCRLVWPMNLKILRGPDSRRSLLGLHGWTQDSRSLWQSRKTLSLTHPLPPSRSLSTLGTGDRRSLWLIFATWSFWRRETHYLEVPARFWTCGPSDVTPR